VTIGAGAASQAFTVTTFTPSVNRTVTITASYAGVVKTVDLLVQIVAGPPAPGPSNPSSLTGRWTGRFTCAVPACAGAFAFNDIQLDVTQGVGGSGTCNYSDGRSGPLTLSGATNWNSNPINLQGGCVTGSLDVIYDPSLDTLRGWFKADYTGSLRRQ
jgi:hypothetical protein